MPDAYTIRRLLAARSMREDHKRRRRSFRITNPRRQVIPQYKKVNEPQVMAIPPKTDKG